MEQCFPRKGERVRERRDFITLLFLERTPQNAQN